MFPIVGIGASAGGLEALSNFLAQVPHPCGMAFVVVQHLERERPSLLVELLQRHSRLPVLEIADGMPVEPDRVYVVPPNHGLVLRDGMLHLLDPGDGNPLHQLIDVFFHSLAEERQEFSVGVLLSGSGSDGTLGMESIKQQGGLTAAQAPATAGFTDMPRRAIEGGLADIVAPAEELPARIGEILGQQSRPAQPALAQIDPDGSGLAGIQQALHRQTGHDFSLYKKNTLYRRIERRMSVTRQRSIQDYLQQLQTHPDEADALLKELLISVTRFFRDTDVWERVRDEIFPALLASHADGATLRVWVPGCATGEEAYTLAMVFCEALQCAWPARNVSLQIFATDLNQRAIAKARKGHYPASIAGDMPAQRLQQFFVADGQGYQISKKIREMVIFAPHNLLADPPFSKLDLLSCRNLLIYLAPDVHAALLGHFHYSMNPDGFLLLGSSESIGGATSLFTPLGGCGQIYRRIDGPQQKKRFDFLSKPGSFTPTSAIDSMTHPMKPALPVDLKTLSDRFLLQQCAPTAVLTNDVGDVLHISGRPDRYLQLAEGRANLNIMNMVRDSLKATLSEAFQDARQLGQSIRLIAAPSGDDERAVEIGVYPLGEAAPQQGMAMVTFADSAAVADMHNGDERSSRQSSRLLMLEQMLRQTRETLQVTREEMQTSREELTSTNEELQSTNEELTTSAEELRTMNEELVRARAESEQALTRYTDLFDSAPVGYFTLDRCGAIMQVNLAGAALLDMERDRVAGGRFTMFVTEADRPKFNACLEQAYATEYAQLCEVALWRDHDQAQQVRISASAAEDGQSCRMVAIDITERRQAEAALRLSEERFRMLWETATDVVVVFDGENRIQYANTAVAAVFGHDPERLIGEEMAVLQPEHLRDAHRGGLETFLRTREKRRDWHIFETTGLHRDGYEFPVEISFSFNDIGGKPLFAGFIRDITERRRAEVREAARSRTMLQIATGTPLAEILDGIVRAVEAETPGKPCSILLLDDSGKRIQLGAAPSLPAFYNEAIDGAPIGPQAGSCGTAAYLNRRVIVNDIQTDPLWADYRQLATHAGLAACWSEPIRSAAGKVLGTFAIYGRQPGSPGAAEINTLNTAVQLASIAIERKQAEAALLRERDFSNQSLNSLPGTFYVIDQQGKFIRWNENLSLVSGYSDTEIAVMPATGFFGPADAELIRQRIVEVFTKGAAQIEVDMLTKDGRRIPYYYSGKLIQMEGQPVLIGMGIDVSERRKAEIALRESEERYRLMFEHSKDALITVVPATQALASANQQALELFGVRDEAEFLATPSLSLSPDFQPDGRPSAEKAAEVIGKALHEGSCFFEWMYRRRNGELFLSEVLLTAMSIGGEAVIQASVRDITARRQNEDQVRLAAMVYQHSSEAMMVTDAGDHIIAINQAFTRLTGYTEAEIIGRNPNILRAEQQDGVLEQGIFNALAASGSWQGELRGRRKNGEIFTEWLTINTAWNADGTVHRRVALFSDISEKKKNEELIWQQANFDFLTGQPNRRMFYERLGQEIKKAYRDQLSVALMFIDLDRFKEVNDTLGHDIGDLLLKEAADRLRRCVRETDFLGRLGGDEFAIILGEQEDPANIDRIAQEILDKMTRPFQLGDETAYVSASIGISLYPDDGSKVEELLKNADQAMYAAKHLGRNRFSYFTPFMQEAAQIRMRLANDLRLALAEDQLRVHYQPIVELATGIVHKAEALVRWQHPTEGLVSPAAFIPIAEETGLIIDIGNWVFHEAAQQAAVWRQSCHADFQISVNKSPVQFRDDNGKQSGSWIEQLHALGLPGQCIAVEITEGLLMDASGSNLAKFQAFRDSGIQVALDDFGTGYSSLSYLKKFDIDYLKIDQSFTRNLAPGSEDMALCEAIIVMAHKLQLKVIAEGIETEQQRDLLIAAGCDYGQGYLFSRPLPAEACDAFLQGRQEPAAKR